MVVKVVFVVVIVVGDGSQVSMRKRIDGLMLQDFASFTSSILLMLLFFIVVEIFFWNCSPNCPTTCLLYTSPSPRDQRGSRMPSSA